MRAGAVPGCGPAGPRASPPFLSRLARGGRGVLARGSHPSAPRRGGVRLPPRGRRVGRKGPGTAVWRRRLWTRAGPFSRISPATAPAGSIRLAAVPPRRAASAGA